MARIRPAANVLVYDQVLIVGVSTCDNGTKDTGMENLDPRESGVYPVSS